MIKLGTACAVLCIFFVTELQAEYQETSVKLEDSYSFTANVNVLYTVWKTDTTLYLNSTDKNLSPCTIAIDPMNSSTIGKIKAKPLKSGRKFIIWGEHDYAFGDSYGTPGYTLEIVYTILLVDPWSCSYKSVQLPALDKSVKNPDIEISVTPYGDTFDIFYHGHENCSPCRFDVEGKPIGLEYQLERPIGSRSYGYYIQPIHPINLKHGYFFAFNFNNSTAVIKYLDEQFKTLKQLYVDHPVHSVSIWPGKDPLVSICYSSNFSYPDEISDNDEAYCQQLDSNLETKLSIRLPVSEKNFVFGRKYLSHKIDPYGNIYVGFIESNKTISEKSDDIEARQLRYFVYDKTGKLLETHNFDKVYANKHHQYLLRRNNGLHSHLFVGDKLYLVDDDIISTDNEHTLETIRTIDIGKYYTQ